MVINVKARERSRWVPEHPEIALLRSFVALREG